MKFKLFSKSVTPKPGSFVLGVFDIYSLKDTENILVAGQVKGTVNVGDTVLISNPGSDTEKSVKAKVLGIENGPGKQAKSACDCKVGLLIENGSKLPVYRASVLSTADKSLTDIHNEYINTLGDIYVKDKDMNISDDEIEKLSITDCGEISRLFSWFHSKDTDEQQLIENKKKIDCMAFAIAKKVLASDEIYCIFSKNSGEPYMFSQTYAKNGGYAVSPPNIRILTKAYEESFKSIFPAEKYEIRAVANGDKKDGIYNFLGSTFYLNGACGVEVLTDDVAISAQTFVPEPDYSDIPERNIPITNPALMRWMLLLSQFGTPKDREGEIIYDLYYRFFSLEIPKAKFLIPMRTDDKVDEPDENGMTILKKGLTIQLAETDGKYGRSAVQMYTDWKRLRMVYDKEWDSMVSTISDMIGKRDCVINLTKFHYAAFYIGKDMYDDMCNFSDKYQQPEQ